MISIFLIPLLILIQRLKNQSVTKNVSKVCCDVEAKQSKKKSEDVSKMTLKFY